jgi:hypothetical protein
MLTTTNFNVPQPIDAAHAYAGNLYRIAVTVLSLIGLITTFALQQRAATTGSMPAAEVTRSVETRISITYQDTYDECWRAEKYLLVHQPLSRFSTIGFGLLIAILLADSIYKVSPVAAYATFPLLWVAGISAWLLFIRSLVWFQLRQRFPQPDSTRECTSTLTPEGVSDQAPDRHTDLRWKEIKVIREHQGDIFFCTALGHSIFIPRGAFLTPEAGDRFYMTAVSLWKSSGTNWDRVAE